MWNLIATNVFGPSSQWFWGMLTFFAIVISLRLIYRQISLQRQANLLHTLGEMDERWNSEYMLKTREQACRNYNEENLKINAEEGDILNFFEDIGLYLERKVFDDEAVWEKYSYYIEHYWAMYKPNINQYRKETEDNTWYDKFQTLHQSMKKFSLKKKVTANSKSPKEIKKFIQGEMQQGAQ